MTKIASISLDIRKNSTVDNEPIVLRQGDSDVIIEASISNDGYPDLGISFATFVAKKPDGTIISNDPANVSGNVISYPVSKHLTESVGKIQDAYFMINNQITTCGFDISIIPSAQLDDTSVNYIPGIESINKFLESTEADWLGRIQQMKTQIAGLDIPAEFKLLMDKALSDAKAQYQPIIDAAEENVESIAAHLAAKKLDLQNNSDELNTTITAIKAQIAPINSFLDGVQKQIIAANASFTADQQAKVSQSIDGLVNQLNDIDSNIKAIDVPDLNAKVDSLDSQVTDVKNKFDAFKDQLDLATQNIGGVRTNLYTDTRDFDNPSVWTNWKFWNKTGDKFNGLTVMKTTDNFHGLGKNIQVKKGETYTFSVYARYQSGTGKSAIYYQALQGSAGVNVSSAGTILSLNETWQRVSGTVNITSDGLLMARIERSPDNTNTLLIAGPKLEKGSIATDYSVNPLDIATNDGVQTAITNALGKVDVGKTITATDDTGKTVNLKITGIS